MNMNAFKASLSLTALGSFVVLSVATSPATFSQTAESNIEEAQVAPEAPVRFLALNTSASSRFADIQLVARYEGFEPAVDPLEDNENDVEAEVQEPIPAENVVRVLSQNPFDVEAQEIGIIQDTILSRLALGSRQRCDNDLCAGYAIITLEHERGEDADLVLKLEGQWETLEEGVRAPTLELVACAEDCQALADAFLSETLGACALEVPTTCSPPAETTDDVADVEDAQQEEQAQDGQEQD